MRIRGVNDAQVAAHIGLSRPAVNTRRTGATRIRPGDIDVLADALEVPAQLFRSEPAAIFRWFADQPVFAMAGSEWAARDSNPEPAGSSLADAVRAA